jgi:Lon-like ATP-dependent protease
MLDSAYYNPDDAGTPRYIHDIFKNGLPADFRLIGATTRSPEELPPALRSRCMEVFFRALNPEEIARVASDAAARSGFSMGRITASLVGQYAACGRDAVNMVQMASGVAQLEGRVNVTEADMEWVIEAGHYARQPGRAAALENRVGAVHGLAVHGSHQGAVMEIEAVAGPGSGRVKITGIVEEEELGGEGRRMRRLSTARASAENVLTLLRRLGYAGDKTDIHINFPGGAPVDGPSAGVTMTTALVSALTGTPVRQNVAMTGEITLRGRVLPIGGLKEKTLAAYRAGIDTLIIPEESRKDLEKIPSYVLDKFRIVPVKEIEEVLETALMRD